MSSERQKKIDEKLWQIEREKKQNSFLGKVASLNLEQNKTLTPNFNS